MERRAYELALSGSHPDYTTIEPILLAEGFVEATQWLAGERVRGDIKALCDAALRRGAWQTHHVGVLNRDGTVSEDDRGQSFSTAAEAAEEARRRLSKDPVVRHISFRRVHTI